MITMSEPGRSRENQDSSGILASNCWVQLGVINDVM